MAIVYPLAWPDLPVAEITTTMVNTVAVAENPFNPQEDVYEWPRQFWKADITLPKMNRENAEKWICFLAKLRGKKGTFLMPPVVGNAPRGTMAGTPVVDGSSQAGHTLDIRGLTASAASVFREGDFIQLGSGSTTRLHKVLDDIDADASGLASVNIWPALRTSPADGASVLYAAPVGRFRLNNNESPFKYVSPQMASITFSVVEKV